MLLIYIVKASSIEQSKMQTFHPLLLSWIQFFQPIILRHTCQKENSGFQVSYMFDVK